MKYQSAKWLAALALSAGLALPALPVAAETLVVSGSGGSLAEILKGLYDEPFAKESGITIQSIASSDRVSLLKAMFAAGKPEWDVSELNSNEYARAAHEGWLEPIDWARLDPQNMVPEEDRKPFAMPDSAFAVVLVTADGKAPEGKVMTSWADFWDLDSFPGPRGLQNSPLHNMEIALLADGVAPGDVYATLRTPEGIDRAFAKLDEIKPAVDLWWTTSAQAPQALADGEVIYTSGYNGRISGLKAAGTPVTMSWDGAILKMGFFGILKGSDKVDAAYRYLNFRISSPERAAAFANASFYPPAVKGMIEFVDADKRADMPNYPDNLAKELRFDEEFWLENQDALTERWQAWMLE